MTILDKIAERTKIRVAQYKNKIPFDQMKSQALSLPKENFLFEQSLKRAGLSFICECKKASPSKGLIAPDFPYLQIAKDYDAAGADAISILTEPEFFLGDDKFLAEIATQVSIPCLRKDFVVDDYMIYQAKILGASAVLLICAILDDVQLRKFIATCDEVGLSALVEAHDERADGSISFATAVSDYSVGSATGSTGKTAGKVETTLTSTKLTEGTEYVFAVFSTSGTDKYILSSSTTGMAYNPSGDVETEGTPALFNSDSFTAGWKTVSAEPVPEPTGGLLTLLGIGMLALRRKRM